jgi:hypothetical protein
MTSSELVDGGGGGEGTGLAVERRQRGWLSTIAPGRIL